MCGIVGFLKTSNYFFDSKNLITNQIELLKHRGPNNQDFKLYKNIAFGHTRLSILDLSVKANQPMESQCGRYMIVYNGEIYNFKDLRKKLQKIDFKTESDTEVIVELISNFGVKKTLNLLDGMFAIGIWDKKKSELSIARDRFGIKPLYWAIHNKSFFFSSELKTFRIIPNLKPKVKKSSIFSLLRYSCIPAPETIFENIFKVEPGKFIVYDKNQKLIKDEFWNSTSLVKNRKVISTDLNKCSDFIESELEKTVSSTMISDVPIGSFLSGGIDSSLITALMTKFSKTKVQSYSIGFENKEFNEANYANKIAKYLQTDHNEAYVSEKELLDVIPLLPKIFSEPFADSSQIPTYLVSKLSSKNTKVILSGDGADELFGGYNRYYLAEKIEYSKRLIPNPIKIFLSKTLKYISEKNKKNIQDLILRKPIPQFNDKLQKLAQIILGDKDFIYENLISSSSRCDNLIKDFQPQLKELNFKDSELCFFETMQFQDLNDYLHNDILTKVDRASMYCSQEVRVPYLNINVVEAAWSLPKNLKKNKLILKNILQKYIPRGLFERPKMGFGIPLGTWLTGCLKDWMLSTLEKKKIIEQGYFCNDSLQKIVRDDLSINRNKYVIWNILMFQCWYDNFFLDNKVIKK